MSREIPNCSRVPQFFGGRGGRTHKETDRPTDDEATPKTSIRDIRLTMINRVMTFHGFHMFTDDWKISLRFVSFTSLLLTTFMWDVFCFLFTLNVGGLTIPKYVEVLTFMQTQGITVYRLSLIVRYREKFKKLIYCILKRFPSWINERTKGVLDVNAKTGMWIYWVHVVQLCTVAMLLTFRPLLSKDQKDMPMHPPLGTLPYVPVDVSPYYEITYLFQVWKTIIQISIAFSMNMIFFTLSVRVCAHIDCLDKDLEALKNEPGEDRVSKLLSDFVDRYNEIREFVDLLNDIFSVVTAIQPLYTGFTIITSLLVFDGTEQSFSFVGIAVAHTLELFIYCYAGDLVAEKSLNLSDKLFQVEWYNFQHKDKRSLQYAIHRCQKPFNINAGFFGNFSRHTFTMTMKTTYSTWAVAKQIK